MRLFNTTSRMAFSVASITVSAVLFAGLIGLIPDQDKAVMEGRARLCQSAGISFTLLATREDFTKSRLGLEALVKQNPELLTVAIRKSDGEMVARVERSRTALERSRREGSERRADACADSAQRRTLGSARILL